MKELREKQSVLKSLKDFFVMNRIVIIINVIFIIIMTILFRLYKGLVEDISTILAVPSFLVTFFVINAVTITPNSLEAYHRRKTMDDAIAKQELEDIIKKFSNELLPITRKYSQYKTYIRNQKNNHLVNKPLANTCSSGFFELRDFYLGTYKFVRKHMNGEDDKLGFLTKIMDNERILSVEEYDELYDFFLGKVNPEELFAESIDDEKIRMLENVFGDKKDLFANYLSTCRIIHDKYKED